MVDDGKGARRLVLLANCPGFCGRIATTVSPGNITYSDCQACSWGYRSVDNFLCSPCDDLLSVYDWLYLIFIAIVPLLFNAFFIQLYASERSTRKQQSLHHACALLECIISCISTVLFMPPRGSLLLYGCGRSSLRDWYPMFYNPLINQTHTLRCAYEVVFPLYSMPFFYLAFYLIFLIVFRSILHATILKHSHASSRPYYSSLFVIPIIALIHALFAGFLYHCFGYLTLLCSLGLNALHMALERNRPMGQMCHEILTKPCHICILLVHMALFGFSLYTLTLNWLTAKGFYLALSAVLLVPVPSLFYLLTVSITHPSNVHRVR